MNGQVEPNINAQKISSKKAMLHKPLLAIWWKTCTVETANIVNDLPLVLCNYISEFETVDSTQSHPPHYNLVVIVPWDIKILGWCPAGSVLPNGEKVTL